MAGGCLLNGSSRSIECVAVCFAAVAVGGGRVVNSRFRPHTGHRGAEAPADPTAGLRWIADFHGHGLRHSPSTVFRMTAAQATESTLPTQGGSLIGEIQVLEAVVRQFSRDCSTGAARRCMNSSGDITMCVVLACQAVLSLSTTCPAPSICTLSLANAGRVIYRHSHSSRWRSRASQRTAACRLKPCSARRSVVWPASSCIRASNWRS